MIEKYYGRNYSLPFQREKCYIDEAGDSLKGINESAESIGLRTILCNNVDLRTQFQCAFILIKNKMITSSSIKDN